jgi:hypothetical protein
MSVHVAVPAAGSKTTSNTCPGGVGVFEPWPLNETSAWFAFVGST